MNLLLFLAAMSAASAWSARTLLRIKRQTGVELRTVAELDRHYDLSLLAIFLQNSTLLLIGLGSVIIGLALVGVPLFPSLSFGLKLGAAVISFGMAMMGLEEIRRALAK